MNEVDNNLLKIFSLTSVITLIISVVAIGWFYKTFAINLLEDQSTETNILLSKTIHNSIHIGIETKLGKRNLYNDESLKFISDKDNYSFLTNIIHDSIEQTPVVKIKIIDPEMKTIFSTVNENIGKNTDINKINKFIKTGKSYTEINHFEEFISEGTTLKNVTILTSYIPMLITHEMTFPNSEEYGLLGVYVDVSDRYQTIISSQWSFVSVITLVLLIIYATLYIEVRRINIITSNKQRDLDNELRRSEKTNIVLGKNFAKVATKRDRAVKENEAKSQFLANMSHELRTPLNAIIGYSEMISDDIDDGQIEKIKEDSGRINSAGKHLLIIINDILDISKIEAGKMELNIEKFNINDMVNEVVATSKPLAEKNNNTILVNSNNNVLSIHSDLTRTRQILLNLISNAIKFTKHGDVTVSINDANINGQPSIEFVVQDTGVGMQEKYLRTIFSPFNQADLSSSKKYEGTGLGLTISKLFCELMNGSISVNSELGQGSTFSVKIPVWVTKNNMLFSNSIPKKGEYCARVLIIDDDQQSREMLTNYLNDLNFYVTTANTSLEGFRVAQNENVDIIILDMKLSGVEGWSILKTIKNDSKTNNIQIVLCTTIEQQELTNTLGADACIIKPLNKELVEETLCNLVGGSNTAVYGH